MNASDRERARVLSILEAIESQSNVSQRHIADRLGVALGLANLYLKRCVRKGLVKITQAPANRYLYYLTPKGFAEKSRLTGLYLSSSFDFYRRAGESCSDVFRACSEQGLTDVLLCGVSELAEIASIRADENEIRLIGTYDPHSTRTSFVGRPVWNQYDRVSKCDAAVLTALSDPLRHFEELKSSIPVARIFVPSVLGL